MARQHTRSGDGFLKGLVVGIAGEAEAEPRREKTRSRSRTPPRHWRRQHGQSRTSMTEADAVTLERLRQSLDELGGERRNRNRPRPSV
jgi:hypothetical protein